MFNFQEAVYKWTVKAFGKEVAKDKVERNQRFLEEALELVQSLDLPKEDALKLVDYVYSRPKGEPSQEVGGVSVTLSNLCSANDIFLDIAAETELYRINRPEILEKIRIKQANKPKNSPLPM